jgi:hypothetical protein
MTPATDDDDPGVATELDVLREQASAALERKDLDSYLGLFSPGLRYRRADGKVLDREQLLRDAREQFRRFDRIQVSTKRTGLALSGGRAEEAFVQTITLGVTAFLFVHRSATYTRGCRCVWGEMDGRWLIDEFEVLDERLEPGRFQFGFRAPPLG